MVQLQALSYRAKERVMRRWLICLGLLVVPALLLTACGGGGEESEPTATEQVAAQVEGASSDADLPTSTPQPQSRPTLPPTWTPIPEGFTLPTATEAEPEEAATPDAAETRDTSDSVLPPTWTPSMTLAPEQLGGGVIGITATPSATPRPLEDICYVLATIDRRTAPYKSIRQGEDSFIYWKPIPREGYSYRVELYHPDGTRVLAQNVTVPEFRFEATALAAGGYTYGWRVITLLDGDEVCYPLAGEIYVESLFE
jgi:hypothetical protein